MYETEKQGGALRVQLFHRLHARGKKSSGRSRRLAHAEARGFMRLYTAICWKYWFYIPSDVPIPNHSVLSSILFTCMVSFDLLLELLYKWSDFDNIVINKVDECFMKNYMIEFIWWNVHLKDFPISKSPSKSSSSTTLRTSAKEAKCTKWVWRKNSLTLPLTTRLVCMCASESRYIARSSKFVRSRSTSEE